MKPEIMLKFVGIARGVRDLLIKSSEMHYFLKCAGPETFIFTYPPGGRRPNFLPVGNKRDGRIGKDREGSGDEARFQCPLTNLGLKLAGPRVHNPGAAADVAAEQRRRSFVRRPRTAERPDAHAHPMECWAVAGAGRKLVSTTYFLENFGNRRHASR
jgi:hypothetical protein